MRKFIGSEFKVIALVVVGLLLGEGAIRSSERWLSIDLTHLKSLDRLSRQACRPGPDGGLQVLFLGNSMTRYGVNPDVFVKAADDRTHRPLTVTKINPDATKIADWYYLYRNFFHEKGRKPDLLIIGFQGDQLSDQPTQHINRLARFYDCRSDDWSDLTRWDLRSFEDVCSYAASCVSGLHGNRDRFDRRVLDLVVPHYREAVARINTVQRQGDSPLPVAMSASGPTYDRLEKFLATAQADGTRVVFVAMPVGHDYQVDPTALTVITGHGAELVDCRNIPELGTEQIPDGIHLSPAGAARYSDYLAKALPWQRLAPVPAPASPDKEPSKVRLASGEQGEDGVIR